MGRGRGGSSKEGEEDIMSRENEVDGHEIRRVVSMHNAPLGFHPFTIFPHSTATITTTAPNSEPLSNYPNR